MYELTKKTYYIDKIHKSLERIIEILNSSDFSHTYCDGLIGIAQMFHYIKNKSTRLLLHPKHFPTYCTLRNLFVVIRIK